MVVYGATKESLSLSIDARDFMKVWDEAGESTVVTLETPEGEKQALIHDVAFHPVSGAPLHVDFYAIDANKPVTVTIPVVFEGVSPAVKSLGGVLVKVLHEIEIEVLPKDLPHNLTVDLSKLESLDSRILVKDIVLPGSAKTNTSPEEVVALVAVPKEEVEEVVAPDLSAIEVEKKGKTEEEGEGEGAKEE